MNYSMNISSDNNSFSSKRSSPKHKYQENGSFSNIATELTDVYSENANLQSINNEYKLEISDLNKRISDLMLEKKFSPQEISLFLNQKEENLKLKEDLQKSQQQVTQLQAFISAQSNISNISNEFSESFLDMKNQISRDISMKQSEMSKTIADRNFEIGKLKNELTTSNVENAQLTLQNLELQKQIRNMNADDSISGAKTQRLQETIDELQIKLEAQKMANDKEIKKSDKLKYSLEQEKKRNQELSKENEQLIRENSILKQQISTSSNDQINSNAKIKILEQEKNQLKQEIQKINLSNDKLQQNINEYKAQIEMNQVAISELKKQMSNQSSYLQKENSKKENQILRLQDEINKQKGKYEEQFTISQKYNEENTSNMKQISLIKEQLNNETEKKQQAFDELNQCKQQLNLLKEKINKERNQNESINSQMSTVKQQLIQSEKLMNQQKEENQNASIKISELQSKINKLNQTIERQKEEYEKSLTYISQYEDQIFKHKKLYQESKEQNDKNNIELNELKSQLQREKQKYQVLRAEHIKNQETVSQYEFQLTRTKRESENADKKSIQFESQLTDVLQNQQKLSLELQHTKMQLQQVTTEKTELELELKDLKTKNFNLSTEIKEKHQQSEINENETFKLKEQLQKLRIEYESIKSAVSYSSKIESDYQKKVAENHNLKKQLDKVSQDNQKLTDQMNELVYNTSNDRSLFTDTKQQLQKVQIQNRDLKRKQIMSNSSYEAALRKLMSHCIKRMNFVNAQYITNLDMMGVKLDHLEKSLNDLTLMFKMKNSEEDSFSYQRKIFLKQIQKHLEIIDLISKTSAKALRIPDEFVPYPNDLLNYPEKLKLFVKRISQSKADNVFCSHSPSQINDFLNS